MTVSAGAVILQTPAAHAGTTSYGTATTARPGAASPTPGTGHLSTSGRLGGVLVATTTATTTAADRSAERASARESAATRSSGSKAGGRRMSRAARQRARASKAVAAAKAKLGSPYRYGGTGPYAFDCSGFVQYAWRKAGVRIPRVTTAQYHSIRTKVSWKNLRPGDLLFFYGKGHVGMYVGKGRMIHSPSSGKRVRIDKLSAWRRAAFSGAVRPGL